MDPFTLDPASSYPEDPGSFRIDGVRNELLKLGQQYDVDTHTTPDPFESVRLTEEQLEDFFLNPIADRVCTLINSLIASGGFNVVQDSGRSGAGKGKNRKVGLEARAEAQEFQGKMQNAIRDAKLLPLLEEAAILASIYNTGAAVILDVDDNPNTSEEAVPNWDQPVNFENIRSVTPLYVLGGRDIEPQTYQQTLGRARLFRFNVGSTRFGFEMHNPHPELGTVQSEPKNKEEERKEAIANEMVSFGLNHIHEDRILWIEGMYTPPRARQRYRGSIGRLNRFWLSYSRYAAALGAASNLLHRSEMIEIAKDGWLETLRAVGSAEGRKRLRQEIEAVLLPWTNMGVLVRDRKKSEIKVTKRSIGGFSQIIKSFKEDMISNAGGLTEMHLFGMTTVSAGLSGNDNRDRLHLEQQCDIRRQSEWQQPVEKFLKLLFLSKDGPTKGKEPLGWRVEWNSTLAQSASEKADLRSKQANTDKIYAELGLPKSDILFSRFDGPYSADTILMDPQGLAEELEAAKQAPPEGEGQPPGGVLPEGQVPDEEGSVEELERELAEELGISPEEANATELADEFGVDPKKAADQDLEAQLREEFQLDSLDGDRLDEWRQIASTLVERGHYGAAREVLRHRDAMGLMLGMEAATREDKADSYQKLANALYRRHPFFAGQFLAQAEMVRSGAIRTDEAMSFSDRRFSDEPMLPLRKIEEMVDTAINKEMETS